MMKPGYKKQTNAAVSSFPRQRNEPHFTAYRLLCSIGLLMITGLLFLIGAQHLQQYRLQRELEDYEQALELYAERRDNLTIEIERLQNFDYIEVLARSRLGLVKPGEIIFQLED